jgi:hypothetical protein
MRKEPIEAQTFECFIITFEVYGLKHTKFIASETRLDEIHTKLGQLCETFVILDLKKTVTSKSQFLNNNFNEIDRWINLVDELENPKQTA